MEPTADTSTTHSSRPQRTAHIGKAIWVTGANGNCEKKTLVGADFPDFNSKLTLRECIDPATRESRNEFPARDANFIAEIQDQCIEPSVLFKCVAVTEDRMHVVDQGGGELSFTEKCTQLCGIPQLESDLNYCEANRQATVGDCSSNTLLNMHTFVTCAGGNAPSVQIESCAPISDKDPVAFLVHLNGGSSAQLFALDDKGAVVDSASAPLTGLLALDRDGCASGTCSMNLLRLAITVGNFSLRGEEFKDLAIGRDEGLAGTITTGGVVRFPGSMQPIALRGTLARDGTHARERFRSTPL